MWVTWSCVMRRRTGALIQAFTCTHATHTEVGLVIKGQEAVRRVADRFELDWRNKSMPLGAALAAGFRRLSWMA